MSMREPPKDEAQDRFEQHLRGFRPVAPQTLAIQPRRWPRGVLAVAAAVLLVIAVPVILKRTRQTQVAHSRQTIVPRASVASQITLGKLNTALRVSDQDMNAMLDDTNPRLLPRGHRGTALFELSKE